MVSMVYLDEIRKGVVLMVLSIAGGIMFAGLLLSALTGVIWFCIGCTAAGILIAGAASAASYKGRAASHNRLAQYPPYGY